VPFRDPQWRRLIWYLSFGLALPWLTFLAACIRYGRLGEVLKLPERLFGAGYNYFALGCFCSIPFVVVAVVDILQRRIRKESRAVRFGVVAAAIATIVLSVLYQMSLWFNMIGPHPDSLIGVGFLILPVLIAALSIVIGALTWAISAVVFHRLK
jgi:hypothetical protein